MTQTKYTQPGKILRWCIITTILFPAAYYKAADTLNEHGVCLNKMRRIPDEELIQQEIKNAIKDYPPIGTIEQNKISEKYFSPKHGEVDPIHYTSIEDFKNINPNCCTIKNFNTETGYIPSNEERRSGFGRGYITLTYKIRFKDKSGKELFITNKNTIPIKNCGEHWPSA